MGSMAVSRPRLLLGALGVALLAGALSGAPARPPAPGMATTFWLTANSLAADRDLAYAATDATRYEALFGAPPAEVAVDRQGRLQTPVLPALTAALGAAVSPRRGPHLVQALLLGIAAWALQRVLRSRLGSSAPAWVAALLVGSVAFRFAFDLAPETFACAAVAVAYAWIWGERGALPTVVPDEIYRGELTPRSSAGRWLLAGAAVGAAATVAPAYLLLGLPPLGALPALRRATSGLLYGGGAALALVGAVALGGAPWEPPQLVGDARLLGWNLVYAAAGRHVGILPYYLPVLLALAAPAREAGRRWIVPAAVGAVLVQVGLAPFDFAGAAAGWGSAAFLPIYAALATLCGGSARSGRPWLAVALAAPFLLPVWLAPFGGAPAFGGPGLRQLLEVPRRLLPFETSLREVPGSVEVRRGGWTVRTVDTTVFAAAGAESFRFFGRRGRVLVASPRPLSSVRLAFGADAPSTLEVRGGEVGSTTFRPSGEVAFDVALGRPLRRHPLWWSREPVAIYALDFDLGKPPAAPLTFDLELARPVVPESPEGDSR